MKKAQLVELRFFLIVQFCQSDGMLGDCLLKMLIFVSFFISVHLIAFSFSIIESDYRFLVSGNYLIFYRACGTEVYIDRVLYGRQDYLRILFDDTATAGEK